MLDLSSKNGRTGFRGPFASQLVRYIAFRRSLGSPFESSARALAMFDRYVAQHHPRLRIMTRSAITDWLATLENQAPSTRRVRLSYIRQFCRYLYQLDSKSYVPDGTLLPRSARRIVAYIYSEDEVASLMRAAAGLRGRWRSLNRLRPWTYVTLIGLLWATGLRISEALKLSVADVDLEARIPSLHVRGTKHFKSRIVPITASTARALRIYRDRSGRYRHASFPHKTNLAGSSFFIHENGRRLAKGTVEAIFKRCLTRAGVQPAAGRQPRLHDFRHTYATRTLAAQRDKGRNPDSILPVLAAYLGHTHVTDTDLYLHPQPDQLRAAGERFAKHVASGRKPLNEPKRGQFLA